jgi:hypothetical protein
VVVDSWTAEFRITAAITAIAKETQHAARKLRIVTPPNRPGSAQWSLNWASRSSHAEVGWTDPLLDDCSGAKGPTNRASFFVELAILIVYYYERSLTTTVGYIEHIENESLYGRGIVKVLFQPGTDVAAAQTQVTAISQTVLKQLPAGILRARRVAANEGPRLL